MANLVVRNIDEAIVNALKERAGRAGRSAEAEHRLILASALKKGQRKAFAEILLSMPNVGLDSDFERHQDDRTPDVFD
jgi:antitoxin FitA